MNRDKWSTGVRYIVEREKEREKKRDSARSCVILATG